MRPAAAFRRGKEKTGGHIDMPDVVRFAVVGVTGYSLAHLLSVQKLADEGRAVIAASVMVDRDGHPEIVADFKRRGIRVFGSYEAMLEECRGGVDVVTLPVPIHLHASMTASALEAGFHVLVEKPAGSTAETDLMIAARDRAGRHCAVGFQALYSPVYRTLKNYVVQGRLGRVRRLRGMALWPRGRDYYGRGDWAGKLTVGGRPVFDSPFNNAMAHEIMNMLFLASAAEGRAAYARHVEAELFRAYPIESFDTGCLRAVTEEGVELFFAASHACATDADPVIRLEADGATVDIGYESGAAITYAGGEVEVLEQRRDPTEDEFEAVCDLAAGRPAGQVCTLETARAHAACVEEVHRSARIRDAASTALPGGNQLVIPGIEEAVRKGYETGRLFSETGASFTRA